MTTVPVDEIRSRAARVAAWSEVNDVRLFQVEAKLNALPDSEQLSYHMDSDVTMQYLQDQDGLIVTGDYTITIQAADASPADPAEGNDDEQEPLYRLAFQLAALFTVDVPSDSHDPLEEDELDAFARTTGQFALHPYARELVADMTARAGLPPLHIGMLKIHLDRSPDA